MSTRRSGKIDRPIPNAAGFTLIEVLVALLVLSVGLLGLAELMSTSLQQNTDALLRSQATNDAYDILDRMRANRIQAIDNVYAVDFSKTLSSSDRAGEDVRAWKTELAELPGGDGEIVMNGTTAVVTVHWYEHGAPAPADGGQYQTISLGTGL